ncbi:Cleavage and polyadenylation specificity factor subunit 1 [Abeliophyllum distichum]|uniref:Cleavage and polyadenylation specificity factor subunit 1 n=1 Tax=Abeliophyllum distichum TaxID=126358 RepID=A0ABD1RTI1_9LAMI
MYCRYYSHSSIYSHSGIEHCASGFISYSAADFTPRILPVSANDLDSDWPTPNKSIGPIPNLITAAANVLEIYTIRVQEDSSSPVDSKNPAELKCGGVLAGISEASLELVCHYRFLKQCAF